MRFRKGFTGTAAGLLLGAACLFSTTPPDRSNRPDGEPPADPRQITLTGLVEFFDRTDYHTRRATDWIVLAVWYGPDTTGDGIPDLLDRRTATSGRDGSYRLTYTDARTTEVEVQARVCVMDEDVLSCCLETPPRCTGPQCQIWTAARRLRVVPGQTYQQNLTVPCDHVP